MTTLDEWVDKEVEKNRRRIAELERRNRALLARRSSPLPEDSSDAVLLANLRAAEDAVQAERTDDNLALRAFRARECLEAGWSKYRIAKELNYSRPMAYHIIDPSYKKSRAR